MASYKTTLAKTIIWRIIATSITILSGWIVSGDWKFGLVVGWIPYLKHLDILDLNVFG